MQFPILYINLVYNPEDMVSTTSEAVSFAVSDPIISELTVGIVNKFIAHARKIPGLADITIKDTE